MKNHLFFPLVAVLMFATAGCHKTGYDMEGMALRAMIDQNRANAEQQSLVDAATGGTIFGADGTIISIAPNAFRTRTGSMVSGSVAVKLLEAYSVGDMVWLNLRTVARNGNQRMALQSGGEVRLRAEANGEQVTVAPGAVQVHFPAQEFDPLMRAFLGQEDADGDVIWDDVGALDQDTAVAVGDSIGGGNWIFGNYYTEPWPANAFGSAIWPDYAFMNCDHPLPAGGDSTDVTIVFPSGTNSSGTLVWIVLPEIDCMVYMEQYVPGGVKAGFPLRIGLQGTVVALRQSGNNDYFASFTPITITDGLEMTIDPQPTTLAAYQAMLQTL